MSRVRRFISADGWVAVLVSLLAAGQTHADGVRASADYTVAAEVCGPGGGAVAGGVYSADTAVGGVVGMSSASAPDTTTKHGYAGQLYDMTGMFLDADPITLDEGGARQAVAVATLDDATRLALAGTEVAWSVESGPLAGVNPSGVVTAGVVYADTEGIIRGNYLAQSDTLRLTVLDVDPDNYGTYAGDELPDDWQVGYFGIGNPDAAPGKDPDGDGEDNRFECVAGLIPTGGVSRFRLSIAPAPGHPNWKQVVFAPRWADRVYSVKSAPELMSGGWSEQLGGVSDNGNERTLTDTNAAGPARFYRVTIAMP